MPQPQSRNKDQYEELGRMTQGLLHNINNSLAGIGGFAELLIDDLSPDSPDRIFAEKILSSSEHLKLLINEVWALNALRKYIPKEIIDVEEALDEILIRIDAQNLASQGIKIEYEVDDNMGKLTAWANSEYLETAIKHLVSNAVESFAQNKVTDRDNLIKISMSCDDDNIFITIEDNGMGMTESTEQQCLNPLFTTKDPSMHHGLGLNIAQAIIRSMAGGFTILSKTGISTTACIMIHRAH